MTRRIAKKRTFSEYETFSSESSSDEESDVMPRTYNTRKISKKFVIEDSSESSFSEAPEDVEPEEFEELEEMDEVQKEIQKPLTLKIKLGSLSQTQSLNTNQQSVPTQNPVVTQQPQQTKPIVNNTKPKTEPKLNQVVKKTPKLSQIVAKKKRNPSTQQITPKSSPKVEQKKPQNTVLEDGIRMPLKFQEKTEQKDSSSDESESSKGSRDLSSSDSSQDSENSEEEIIEEEMEEIYNSDELEELQESEKQSMLNPNNRPLTARQLAIVNRPEDENFDLHSFFADPEPGRYGENQDTEEQIQARAEKKKERAQKRRQQERDKEIREKDLVLYQLFDLEAAQQKKKEKEEEELQRISVLQTRPRLNLNQCIRYIDNKDQTTITFGVEQMESFQILNQPKVNVKLKQPENCSNSNFEK